jgi:hypothetical protein
MSHLLSDIAQPMHTAETKAERSEHLKYEGKVDARCEASPPDCIYRFSYDGMIEPGLRKRTLREVRRAKPYYSDLIDEVAKHGYNNDIHRITRRQFESCRERDCRSHYHDATVYENNSDRRYAVLLERYLSPPWSGRLRVSIVRGP